MYKYLIVPKDWAFSVTAHLESPGHARCGFLIFRSQFKKKKIRALKGNLPESSGSRGGGVEVA